MPVQQTRSGRTVKNAANKQSKLDALELLARQRRGEKVDIGVQEDEPLFEEVDEEEYKRTRKGGFVVDKSDDEYESDDEDFIDDGDYDEEETKEVKKRSKGKQPKDIVPDPRQKSLKNFLGASSSGTSRASLSSSESSKKTDVNMDDLLSQMLYQDVPSNRSSAITMKPTISRLPSQNPVISRMSQHKPALSVLNQTPEAPIARRVKADQDTPTKRLKVSSPPQPTDDDCFDEIMPDLPDNEPVTTSQESLIHKPMTTQESVSPHAETPLDEDTKTNLEFLSTDSGKPYIRFYWFDCCEGQAPGTVYFFGRVYAITIKRFVSCCVIVRNVRRSIYLMISPHYTYEETLDEFNNVLAKKYQIKNYTCEKVVKKYAFAPDPNIPLQSEFVKVDYPANQATLPADLKGKTFCQILNTHQTPMERLILNMKLRGPCWLRIVEPSAPSSPLTWSRIELVIESADNLLVEHETSNLKPPYFCVLSIALQTLAQPTRNDIVAISVMYNTSFNLNECLKRSNKASGHFIIMARPSKQGLRLPYDFNLKMKSFRRTKFELVDSERDLLLNFMDKFQDLDPDIVVGHDLLNFDFETLVRQMVTNKVGIWSKLGRFKRSTLVSTKKAFPYLFSGRVLCDIKKMAEELMQLRSYDLTELASQILNQKRVEYNHETVVESFRSSEALIDLITATWEDVDCIFSILVELNIIPLALKITNITGNILSRTLAAGRSERNEYLLLHAFHEENFICPDKKSNENSGARKKAAYAGGLVLEPKAGLYETFVLLMDFNSLYPSIIQEFNICFSTVKIPENDEILANVPSESIATGVLPAQLKDLVSRRRQVKQHMANCKDPMKSVLFDIEQRALKLTANSMYGCLGFEQSRFYAKHLASLVTSKGREILMNTKALVESLGFDVLYGDTDSLMIDTKTNDFEDVIQKGNAIKSTINRQFKLLEIDIDGVYRPLLLLKKKNYAGAKIDKLPDGKLVKKIETKGLDSVRRDRAVVAKEAGERVLSIILESEKDVCFIVEDIHAYLKELAASINNDQLALEKYLISKQLNKNPEEYKDIKGIGHVNIALRRNKDTKQAKKLRAGDVIDYLICLDGSKESANQRCYTLEEMKSDTNLKVDHEYYLCQQIYPAISRICEKLPFTNAYVIAEALGIESSSLIKIPREQNEATKRDQLVSRGEARFNTCEPMVINCPDCHDRMEICHRLRKNLEGKLDYSLTSCDTCKLRLASKSKHVVVQVIGLIKRLIQRLYNTKFVCADCEVSTRNVFGPLDSREMPLCHSCASPMTAEMDDKRMDLQLNFYKYLLDTQEGEVPITDDTASMYRRCHAEVLDALRMSFINTIDAQHVFSMVCSNQ